MPVKKQRKRTANDFLAMLSEVVVQPEEGTQQNEESKQSSKVIDDTPVDVIKDLPTITTEGSPVLFNDWFNKTDHSFFFDKPDLKLYRSDLGLILSTKPSVPGDPVSLHPMLQNGKENIEIIKDKYSPSIFDYRDFLFVGNENKRIRKIAALHAVDHIYQDFMAKENRPSPDFKDSNFTPSIVLVICPHKLQAYQFIIDMINCLPNKVAVKNDTGEMEEQQFQIENFDKLSEYTVEGLSDHYLRTRAADWLETFGGNSDSDFKTGIRFFKNKVSLFQEIAKSQIVIASPLAISLFEEKSFLSSVEVLILDSIDVLTIQHSDRLSQTLIDLNKLPKTVGQTDWSRLRQYCADNNHRKMRQSIGYGAILSPEIYNIYHRFENIRGQLIFRPIKYPRILLPDFERDYKKMNCSTIDGIGEAISRTFKDKLFPLIKQWRSDGEDVAKRTLIYFVSSYRFFQARKILEDDMVNYLELSDESTKQDSTNMKKAFRKDPNSVMLMTERHYFYFRPKLGAERVVFLQPPSYPQFASEIAANCPTTIFFTEFDELALERIAGSEYSPKVLENDSYSL